MDKPQLNQIVYFCIRGNQNFTKINIYGLEFWISQTLKLLLKTIIIMNKIYSFLFLGIFLCTFSSCVLDEEGNQTDKIDKVKAKEKVQNFSQKAKELLEGEDFQKIKDLIKDEEQAQKFEEATKDLGLKLENFNNKAQKVLDGDQIDKITNAAKNIEGKVKELENSGILKEKIENLKNDPDIKKLIDDNKGGVVEIIKQLEEILNTKGEESEK